ncbi:MAG: nicotinate (nicotinamide) nucleotide adenylyltransferase [Bacteroidaceae bacterium]|nr:nicotinate (nicotinamide) nucleotide adenylyltransferase [Bacteroidaceae bacterium]
MCTLELKKIVTGVYGGSFNPIHNGHTAMASEMVRRGIVDEMWLVVSPQNPLKTEGLWDDDFRLALARTAVADAEGVYVSDVEFGLPRPNYMIVTLETLSARFPDREFVLVIGRDNWERFCRWYRWRDILRMYRVVVLPRSTGGCNGVEMPEASAAGVVFADVPLVDLSSTWIRSEIQDNPVYDGEGLCPEVWRMIKGRFR